jgi:hypothetical protein
MILGSDVVAEAGYSAWDFTLFSCISQRVFKLLRDLLLFLSSQGPNSLKNLSVFGCHVVIIIYSVVKY